jgi:hypothetical protein
MVFALKISFYPRLLKEERQQITPTELKNQFIKENKAFINALESGVSWDQLIDIRLRLIELQNLIDQETKTGTGVVKFIQRDPI